MTESYSPIEIVMKYYGNSTTEGANMPFNFQLLEQLNNGSSANDYKSAIDYWLKNMPIGRTANWVVGNHDQNRVASRLGTDRVDGINMIVLTLPGASVTYNVSMKVSPFLAFSNVTALNLIECFKPSLIIDLLQLLLGCLFVCYQRLELYHLY